MKYQIIGDNNTYNPTETVLKNREITLDLFNLDENVIEDYNGYDNMQEGIELLMKHINQGSKILNIVDSDVDGLTSSSIIYNYLKDEYGIEMEYKLHTGKQHGLSEDIIIEDDIDLVIIPDASVNDFKQHLELKERGIDILILDHHDCDKGYSQHALVINNQLSENISNKDLSGVGVVYKFLKAIDDYLYTDKADYYLDLVALGNVADVMDLRSRETRYFVYEGCKNINNLFIKALMEDNEFDLDGKYNIDKIGWTIAPKLNGTIRSGTMKEKQDMFKAFISDDYDFCLKVAKQCKNAKGRQDRKTKKGMADLQKDIKFEDGDKCIIVGSKSVTKNQTGLVAGKLTDIYGVPIMLFIDNDTDIVSGSARGNNNITNTFREDTLETGLFIYNNGHSGASGWSCKRENIPKIKEFLNEKYKDKEVISGKEYRVDFILEEEEIISDFVNELAELENEWGNGLDAPLIAFKNIHIRIEVDNLKGLNIIFSINNIKFIKKFATNILKQSLLGRDLVVDIIGKCTINSYNGIGQVEIVDMDVI